MICRRQGLPARVVMPDNVTEERTQLLRMYGAEIVYSEGAKGSNGAVEMALEMAGGDSSVYMPYQYGNEANPRAHYDGTAVEILDELDDVTAFVAGLGTGGTLMGVGRRLKETDPETKIVAAEPMQGELVQGLRSLDDGFIPPIIDLIAARPQDHGLQHRRDRLDQATARTRRACSPVSRPAPWRRSRSGSPTSSSRQRRHQLAARCAAARRAADPHLHRLRLLRASRRLHRGRPARPASTSTGARKLLGEVGGDGRADPAHLDHRSRAGRPPRGLLEWFLAQRGAGVRGYPPRGLQRPDDAGALPRVIGDADRRHPRARRRSGTSAPSRSTSTTFCTLLRDAFGAGRRDRAGRHAVIDRSLDSAALPRRTGWTPPTWPHMIAELAGDAPYDARRSRASMLTGKRVLVTGGTGSLGQTLVRRLLDGRGSACRRGRRLLARRGEAARHAARASSTARVRPTRSSTTSRDQRLQLPHRRRARLRRASRRRCAAPTSSSTPRR